MDIRDNANDLTPVVGGANTDALAQRGGGVVPIFPCRLLGENCHRPLSVDVIPGQITSGNERCSQRCKESRRNEFESADRREFAFLVSVVLGKHRIEGAISVHRNGRRDGDRRNAGMVAILSAISCSIWVTRSRCASGIFASGIYKRNVCSASASAKPGSTCIRARKVRIISPEQISRTSARATCTT